MNPAAPFLFLLLLSLGICMASALSSSAPAHCHARLQEFFSGALDRNGDGMLSLREVHLMRTATAHGEQTPPLAASDAASFLHNADTHPADGSISFWEFCNALDGRPTSNAAGYSGSANALDGQVHLSLTGAAGEMRVTFVTKEPLTRGIVSVSMPGAGNTTVLATTTHYTVPKRAWEPTGNGGYIHSTVLSGLPPATTVTYRPHGTDIRGDAVDFGVHSFATAPSAETSTKIALLGKKRASCCDMSCVAV